MKDNDKPGFIVRSCSLLTAYDEYLQKGSEGGVVKLSVIFLQQVFFQRRGQSDSHPASSPLFRPSWQRHCEFLCTHTHITHLSTDLQKATGEVKG